MNRTLENEAMKAIFGLETCNQRYLPLIQLRKAYTGKQDVIIFFEF